MRFMVFKNLFYPPQFPGQIYGSKGKELIPPTPHNSRGLRCLGYRTSAFVPDLCIKMPNWPR